MGKGEGEIVGEGIYGGKTSIYFKFFHISFFIFILIY